MRRCTAPGAPTTYTRTTSSTRWRPPPLPLTRPRGRPPSGRGGRRRTRSDSEWQTTFHPQLTTFNFAILTLKVALLKKHKKRKGLSSLSPTRPNAPANTIGLRGLVNLASFQQPGGCSIKIGLPTPRRMIRSKIYGKVY